MRPDDMAFMEWNAENRARARAIQQQSLARGAEIVAQMYAEGRLNDKELRRRLETIRRISVMWSEGD